MRLHEISRAAGRSAYLAAAIASALIAVAPVTVHGAEDGTNADDDLENIIVTARRREENAQEVPLAISVVGGERSTRTAPSTSAGCPAAADAAVLFVEPAQHRGQHPRHRRAVRPHQRRVRAGRRHLRRRRLLLAPRLGDVRLPRRRAGRECCAGRRARSTARTPPPARSTSRTNQPTFDFEGSAEVSLGNLGLQAGQGGGLRPVLRHRRRAPRVSATDRRGTIYNVTTGNWINAQDNLGVRGQLLWRPSDNLDVTLAGDYSAQDPNAAASPCRLRPDPARGRPAISRRWSPIPGYAVAKHRSVRPPDRPRCAAQRRQRARRRLAARDLWDLATPALTSITAWRFWDWGPGTTATSPACGLSQGQQPAAAGPVHARSSATIYERPLSTSWSALFAFQQRIDTRASSSRARRRASGCSTQRSALVEQPGGPQRRSPRSTTSGSRTPALARFRPVNWNVTDRFTFQPGVRVNYDKKEGLLRPVVTGTASDGHAATRPPVPGHRLTIRGRGAARHPRAAALRAGLQRLELQLRPDRQLRGRRDDRVVYGPTPRPSRPGGINHNGVPADATAHPILAAGYDPAGDRSTTSSSASRRSSGTAGRRSTSRLPHRRSTTSRPTSATASSACCAAISPTPTEVRTQGVEVDFSVRPSERFNAYVNGAYTDAKYVRFVDAPCPPELAGGTGRPAPDAGRARRCRRAQPGQLRRFGPASCRASRSGRSPTGREGNLPVNAVRPGRRGLPRLRRQLPLGVLVEPVAVDLHLDRRLRAAQLPRRLPHRRLRCSSPGSATRSTRTTSTAPGRSGGNTGLIAAQVGRPSDVWLLAASIVLIGREGSLSILPCFLQSQKFHRFCHRISTDCRWRRE